jgi:hypothetical protein
VPGKALILKRARFAGTQRRCDATGQTGLPRPRPGQEATALVTVAVRHTATAGVRGWGFFRDREQLRHRYYGPAESRLRYR